MKKSKNILFSFNLIINKAMLFLRALFIIFLSSAVYAGDEKLVKKKLTDNFTSSLSSAVENFLDGEGDTKVQINMGEDYKPEFSIVTVRPNIIPSCRLASVLHHQRSHLVEH